MNREESNKKKVADDFYKIAISSLKLNSFLKTGVIGTIDITCDSRIVKDGVVHLVVSLQNKLDPYLYFYYAILQPDGAYRPIEYRVDLVMTSCNYGGARFWYKCPVEILGCDRRVAVLYKVGDLYACRNCFQLSYKTRNKRGFDEWSDKHIALIKDASDPRWKSYGGKPTRRFKRAQKMKVKLDKYMAILRRKNEKAKKRREKHEKFIEKEMKLMEEERRHKLDPSGQVTGRVSEIKKME